jgi:site-specific DNA recombinase
MGMTSDDTSSARSVGRELPRPARTSASTAPGTSEDTGIYCRKSKIGDKDQITVTRQKKLALADCAALGLRVRHIYIDNGVSAWQRNRKREGWDELIAAARRGEIKHIMCYHPDRLMRQPHDLEELLSISDQYGIMLYGRVNRRNLQDPDDRYALRIEVAHACRSSDDTSRRLKDEIAERAEKGMPHTGKRRYGYSKSGMKIVQHEADVIREIFDRFIDGEAPTGIAKDLNSRGIKTALGKTWAPVTVRQQLRSWYVAGVRIYHGKNAGKGVWPAIIDRGTWDVVQEMMDIRAVSTEENKSGRRFYVLRGIVAWQVPMAVTNARVKPGETGNAVHARYPRVLWRSSSRMQL